MWFLITAEGKLHACSLSSMKRNISLLQAGIICCTALTSSRKKGIFSLCDLCSEGEPLSQIIFMILY